MPNKPGKYRLIIRTLCGVKTLYLYNGYLYDGKGSDGIGMTPEEKKCLYSMFSTLNEKELSLKLERLLGDDKPTKDLQPEESGQNKRRTYPPRLDSVYMCDIQ